MNHSSCSGPLPIVSHSDFPCKTSVVGACFSALTLYWINTSVPTMGGTHTHTHKKTMTFNNGDYSNNCKIVTKILHKEVSIHINKREIIKNGKQLFLINVGFAKLTHWKRHWCWARLKVGGEADNRGWDGWMALLTQWTWIWVNSGSWWWTGRPGVLRSMDSQRVWHDWVTELNLATLNLFFFFFLVLGTACRDLSSQTRNGTRAPCNGITES